MDSRLDDPVWLADQYQQRTLVELAAILGVCPNTVRNRMVKFGIDRRTKGEHFKGQPKTRVQRNKMSAARRKFWDSRTEQERQDIATNISGGKRTKNGIGTKGRRIYVPGRGRVLEHRYVMEQELGRALQSSEHVHHIDGNRLNNSPDNLRVVTNRKHQTFHAQKLTDDDVIAIRTAWDNGTSSQAELARRYGVAVSTIWRIVHRRRWKHI